MPASTGVTSRPALGEHGAAGDLSRVVPPRAHVRLSVLRCRGRGSKRGRRMTPWGLGVLLQEGAGKSVIGPPSPRCGDLRSPRGGIFRIGRL